MTEFYENPRHGRAKYKPRRKVPGTTVAAGWLAGLAVAYGLGALLAGNDGFALLALGLALGAVAVVVARMAGESRKRDQRRAALAVSADIADNGAGRVPPSTPETVASGASWVSR